ncbi:DUF5347 family protein [Xenorhabdus innexi]|uniref:Phage-related protein n=1 Tax=Xenorhabdus innexi TaxID=290109 RepID=A0A1N6MS43_9GAMM|nr:DUF5347 family protein [Xenorhabdus innexi]PHM38561.1 Phage-related protein [Xenorhabdus innexi]SIP71559.1 Phage-related protein [Xenorhabdus innexi]
MANTESYRSLVYTLDRRIDFRFNYVRRMRSSHHFESSSDRRIAKFIKNMRDPDNNQKRNNERLLHVIFNLAGFPESKYHAQYEDLTKEEKNSLIEAMVQYKTVADAMPGLLAR